MSEPPALMVQAPPAVTDSDPAGVGLPMSAHVQSVGQPGGGGAELWTTRVTVVLCVAEVPVPVTVTEEVPVGVVVAVVIVMVELLPELTDAGLKPAVAPLGRPLALSATFCNDPLVVAVLIDVVPLLPGATVTVLGLALMEKSFGGGGEPQVPVPQTTHTLFDENGPVKPAVATTVSTPVLLVPVLSLYVHETCPLLSV